jgi:hypothetical protein
MVGEFRGVNFQKGLPAIRQQKLTRGNFRFEKFIGHTINHFSWR